MKLLTVQDAVKVSTGEYKGDKDSLGLPIRGMAVDSRNVEPGFGFVAIKGDRVDAHRFIGDVLKKGASCVLCSYVPEDVPENSPLIVCKDPAEALRKVAAFYRSTFDIPVVGIIGSVGKTSTKEYTAAVLSQKYRVLKTKGNLNSTTGLPITLMSVAPEHTMAVVEMGINQFGEMRLLSSIAKPDAVIFTNVAPAHLEFLGDLDGVLKAKSEVFENMDIKAPVFINGDDPYLRTLKESQNRPVISCGFGEDCDIRPVEGFEESVKLHGKHMASDALLALGCGKFFGIDTQAALRGIESVMPVMGRSNFIEKDNFTVVDDCYNANPTSMKAAIDMLMELEGKKIAVLGDMGELGDAAGKYHRDIGEYALSCKVDMLFCAGELSYQMAEGFMGSSFKEDCSDCRYYKDTEILKKELLEYVHKASGQLAILVKASHSMGFDSIVKALLSE